MNCPTCGAELPEGSAFCPTCGATFANDQQAYADPNAALFNQNPGQAPYGDANAAFDSSNYGSAPKKKTGLIVGIIAGIVAVVALVLVLVLFVFKGGADGHYVCNDFSVFGIEFTLDVDGDEFTMTMSAYGETETESGTIEFDGDTVTMIADGETLVGEYNKKDGTIIISEDTFGMSITFTKE